MVRNGQESSGSSPRSIEDTASVPVTRLVKNTTPKGLREVRNVLRWRVPNENPTITEAKNALHYNANVDRPRSAPSASLSDSMPDKLQRQSSFQKFGRSTSSTNVKAKANSVHKRHWMYLYDNLHRAVDEMHKTCEQDFSAEQCINVIHTLELCMEDFKRLAHKIRVLSGSNDDYGSKQQRSIAWEESHARSVPTTPTHSSQPHSTSPIPLPLHTPIPPDTEILLLEEIENKYDNTPSEPDSPIWTESRRLIEDSSSDDEATEEEKTLLLDEVLEPKKVDEIPVVTIQGNEEIPWAERLKRSLSQTISAPSVKPKPVSPQQQQGQGRTKQKPPTLIVRKLGPTASPPLFKNPKSPEDIRILQDEKQAKATKNREQYVSIKKEKVALVLSRVRDVTERQSQKIATRQASIDEKQEKAVIIHEAHIDHIKRKATAENTKVDEVAYITNQNTETQKFIQQKRLDDTEARRQGQLEGKKKKLVVQAAKEEAVVERKKQIEHARYHMMQMNNDVLTSPTPTTGHHRKSPSKSPKKNRSKVDMEMEARRLKRVCKYCNVELLSEEYLATHLSGRKHQQALKKQNNTEANGKADDHEDENEAEGDSVALVDIGAGGSECVLTIPLEPNLPYLTISSPEKIEAIVETEKAQKKKAKKTRLQIAQLALSYVDPGVQPPKESPHKSRLVRSVADLKNVLAKKSFSTMPGVLSDISRVLSSKGGHSEIDLQLFRQLGGIELLVSICGNPDSKIPYTIYSECISLLSLACTQPSNRLYILLTGKLVPLIDLLNKKILVTPEASFLPALATLLTLHFWQPAENADEIKKQTINYVIQICLFEKIEQKLAQLQTNIDGDPSASLFIEKKVEFLESITAFLQANTRDKPIYVESIVGSEIVQVFKKTNIIGILSLLASLVLQAKPSRGSAAPPPALPATIWSIIFSSVKVLNNIAALDFKFLQSFLGNDDNQVEMFHLLGHLLWYCSSSIDDPSSPKRHKLLNEIMLLAGYYALQNSRTQETFQWGNSPTILQLLCGLPFQYFSDARYKTILFPTLIAVCFQNARNVSILQQEMSIDLIVDYIKAEIDAKENTAPQVPARFLFKNRFPATLCTEALEFFTPKSSSTPPPVAAVV